MGRPKNATFFQVRFFMYIEFACVLSSESGFTYMEKGYFSCGYVRIVNCEGSMGICTNAQGPKTLSFYEGRPSPCTPPHEGAKNVPKRSPGVRFHGGLGRVSF